MLTNELLTTFHHRGAFHNGNPVSVSLKKVYIPLYVQETLKLSETFIATVPFAMYLAGFLGSLVMKEINKKIGRKVRAGGALSP